MLGLGGFECQSHLTLLVLLSGLPQISQRHLLIVLGLGLEMVCVKVVAQHTPSDSDALLLRLKLVFAHFNQG